MLESVTPTFMNQINNPVILLKADVVQHRMVGVVDVATILHGKGDLARNLLFNHCRVRIGHGAGVNPPLMKARQ